jgi:putative peptidoglycan lipid II flippase
MPSFRRTLNYGIRLALFLTVPASVLLFVLAQPLLTLVYQRGNFLHADTLSAVPALQLYALGVWAWSAQAVVARAYYARNDTWTPVLCGTLVTFGVFIPLNFLLTPFFHQAGTPAITRGPALATSLASITNVFLLMFFAARRFGGINGRRIVLSLARVLAACVPLTIVAWEAHRLLQRYLGDGHLSAAAQLVAGGVLGLAAFLATAALLGSEETRELKGLLRRR